MGYGVRVMSHYRYMVCERFYNSVAVTAGEAADHIRWGANFLTFPDRTRAQVYAKERAMRICGLVRSEKPFPKYSLNRWLPVVVWSDAIDTNEARAALAAEIVTDCARYLLANGRAETTREARAAMREMVVRLRSIAATLRCEPLVPNEARLLVRVGDAVGRLCVRYALWWER